jgi:hypothetical protein
MIQATMQKTLPMSLPEDSSAFSDINSQSTALVPLRESSSSPHLLSEHKNLSRGGTELD